MYVFNDTNKVFVTDIFTAHKTEFGLGTYDAMVLFAEDFLRPEGTGELNKGSLQSNYVQYYKGYEVEGTVMNVTSKCGIVLEVFDLLVRYRKGYSCPA